DVIPGTAWPEQGRPALDCRTTEEGPDARRPGAVPRHPAGEGPRAGRRVLREAPRRCGAGDPREPALLRLRAGDPRDPRPDGGRGEAEAESRRRLLLRPGPRRRLRAREGLEVPLEGAVPRSGGRRDREAAVGRA